ncbi:MAG: hypothetical protein U5L05_03055 [Rubrivivax sp.]|nr:hypothetical protein [Rubrivivax sp.]
MPTLRPALALTILGFSKATVPAIVALVLMLAIASPLRAASPAPAPGSASPEVKALAAGQPPTLSNFRADEGVPLTWDKDVALTWTQQGLVKEWRVSANSGFLGSPWMALPAAQPYKWILGSNPGDGTHYIYMQLRNEHGESAVASTSIEYRQPPKLSAYSTITRVAITEMQFDVRLTFQGKLTRWALTATSSPPSASAAWKTHAQAIASPATAVLDFKFYPYVSEFDRKLVSGSTVTTWLHAQRDNGPIDSRQLDFVYTGPQRTFWLDVQQTRAFVQRLGERSRIGKQLLTAAGRCEVFSNVNGSYIWGPVAQGFYVVGSPPIIKPMRCRFNVFDNKALAPGWTLAADSVQLMQGSCRIVTRTGGTTPNLALEIQLDQVLGNTGGDRYESCHVEGLRLDGPWSDVTQPWLLAIP